LELEETESPTFWVVDFSPEGWRVDPAESAVPLNLSPMCSVVDFSESGLRAAPALSVKDWRPRSDMFKRFGWVGVTVRGD
jgi:hypothetical protein